jgi:hypothetical protein
MKLSRKVEKAVSEWLKTESDLDGLNIYEGHEAVDAVEFPSLVIYAESSSPVEGLPQETGCRVVRLRCKITVDETATERGDVDDWESQVHDILTDDRAAMQAALNKPASGDDERPVKKIHFHQIELMDNPSDRSETDWEEDLLFDVTCEPLDA